jgi:hypothetical protein
MDYIMKLFYLKMSCLCITIANNNHSFLKVHVCESLERAEEESILSRQVPWGTGNNYKILRQSRSLQPRFEISIFPIWSKTLNAHYVYSTSRSVPTSSVFVSLSVTKCIAVHVDSSYIIQSTAILAHRVNYRGYHMNWKEQGVNFTFLQVLVASR